MAIYSSKILNESALPLEEAVNPLQFAIDMQRDDLKLFNAIIESDFAELQNEAGMITLSESEMSTLLETEGTKISEKIKIALDKIKAFVVNLFSKFMENVDKLFKNDTALVKKYGAYVTAEKCKGCPVAQETIDNAKYDTFVTGVKQAVTRADFATSNGISMDAIKTQTDKLTALINENASSIVIAASEKKLVEIVDFAEMVKVVAHDGNSIKDDAKKFKAESEKKLVEAERSAKTNRGSAESKEDNAALNEVYKAVTSLSNLVSKACSIYCKFAAKKLSVYRKNYITLGAWAMRNEGKVPATKEDQKTERVEGEVVESTLEETYAYLLAEASDMYTEDVFSLAF